MQLSRTSRTSPLRSTRLRRRKRNALIAKVVATLVLLLVLVGAISWLSGIKALAISNVAVKGNIAVESADIQNTAQAELIGSYAHLISRSDKFFYPAAKIRANILSAFPRIASVSTSVSGNTLVINVTERTPSYLWCQGAFGGTTGTNPTQTVANQTCYLTDSTGYVFAPAPTFSGNTFFLLYGNISNSNPVGQHYASLSDFQNLMSFVESLKNMKLSSRALVAEGNDVYYLYLSGPGRIIFTSDEDPTLLESDVATVNSSLNLFSGSGSSTLDYLDLRFGDKVYYKFVGDSAPQQSQ